LSGIRFISQNVAFSHDTIYPGMTIHETRQHHDTFSYRGFDIQSTHDLLEITFSFHVSPHLEFTPKVTLPLMGSIDHKEIENLAFHLGLIEAISYWKATCSPNFVVEAGYLDPQQILWWHDLFIHGLGEFYFQNQIDFRDTDFLTITSPKSISKYIPVSNNNSHGDLILVGGGKDSITTLEMVKKTNNRIGVLLLNPTKAALDTTILAEKSHPLIVTRTIDNRLLELNQKGYLNGHTPFSAYLSFLGTFMGILHGYEHIITSNELSAGEGNTDYLGMEVNHQYSKSYRYEKMFRQYSNDYLTTSVSYFSVLRPLSELQIAALFSKVTKYDKAFSSCNISRNKYWCGECAKCAFVYLVLNPFLDPERTRYIFGDTDFFQNPKIQQHVIDLVGLGKHKPFECVGTEAESRQAVALIIYKYRRFGLKLPSLLTEIDQRLHLTQNASEHDLLHNISHDWSKEHFLPDMYKKLLQSELNRLTI
jgi:hypothetical protein